MRIDTNTNGHMQWYYFSVKNEAKQKVKFNIFRFRKRYSLYQRGMCPYTFSKKRGNWTNSCENVKYYRERVYNQNGVKVHSGYYYLSFTYRFQHQKDEVLFAAGIPYTTTYLARQLQAFKTISNKSQYIKFETGTLCVSLCGQDIDLVTIQAKYVLNKPKQFIIINARSHSGEASASWVLDGLIEFIVNSTQLHQWIVNRNICFKIVPMLNKDGVFMGNYRTGILGQDFNRRFKSGTKQYYPQIFGLKSLVTACKSEGHVKLFLDLHGHSILKNNFIFGPDKQQFPQQQLISLGHYLMHSSKYFSRKSSYYKNEKRKIQTARVYFQFEQQILSLTCENSLGLYCHNDLTLQQNEEDWKIFGSQIVQAMMDIATQGQIKNKEIFIDNNLERIMAKFKRQERRQVNKSKSIYDPEILTYNSAYLQKQTRNQGESQIFIKKKANMQPIRLAKQNLQPKKTIAKIQSKQQAKNIFDDKEYAILENSIIVLKQGKNNAQSLINEINHQRESTPQKKQDFIDEQIIQSQDEQQIIQDNFSDEYCSMNDSDSSVDDLDSIKKMELLRYIKEIRTPKNEVLDKTMTLQTNSIGKPIKGFKQYRFDRLVDPIVSTERKTATGKLKPLKYLDMKSKATTERKIRSNVEMFDNNHSSLIEQARLKDRVFKLEPKKPSSNMSRLLKRQEILSEMFPASKEYEQCTLMQIRELKMRNRKP